MPYCPVCRNHFEDESVRACPKDGAELVDELPYNTVEGPEGNSWVEIAGVGTEDEARLLQGFLDSAGIPTQVESLKFHMEPVNFGGLGEVRIYVAAENESRALDLLEKRRQEYAGLEEDEVNTDEGPAEIDDDSEAAEEPARR